MDNLQVWKCSQKEGRNKCVALYTNDEYEELTIEAHITCRRREKRGFDRYPFFCKFCKHDFRDKNGVNYHRILDVCPAYTGPFSLKMYPVWDQGDQKELERITKKHGHDLLKIQRENIALARRRAGAHDEAGQGDERLEKNKKVDRSPAPAKKIQSMKETLQSKGKQNAATAPTTKADEHLLKKAMEGSVRKRKASPTEKHKDGPVEKKKVTGKSQENGTAWAEQQGVDYQSAPLLDIPDHALKASEQHGLQLHRHLGRQPLDSVQGSRSDQVDGPSLPEVSLTGQRSSCILKQRRMGSYIRKTVEGVEAQARATAATFTVEEHGDLGPPPLECHAPGLYYIIRDGPDEKLIKKGMLDDPKLCMDTLQQLNSTQEFSNRIGNAFSDWFVNTPPDIQQKSPWLLPLCRETLWLWNTSRADDTFMDRMQELKNLKLYLEYLKKKSEYEDSIKNAHSSLEARRVEYVRQKVTEFKNEELMKAEDDIWGWSPLFTLLKDIVPSSAPQRPWSHTEEEWAAILVALQEEDVGQPLSLEDECPHIVRALKMFFRATYGRRAPITHPKTGLSKTKLIDIGKDQQLSQRLTVCYYDITNSGWLAFPNMSLAKQGIEECEQDMACLLGYSDGPQDRVLGKIAAFINRLARRAVLDAHRAGLNNHLANMWYKEVKDAAIRFQAEQVREWSLLMQWIFVISQEAKHPC